MKKIFFPFLIAFLFSSFLMSQSLYLDKERSALAITPSFSFAEDISILSIGTSFSLNKKLDISFQYSNIHLQESEDQYASKADGISGALTLWGTKTQEDFPIEIALSILGSYVDYKDFNSSSFGAGLTLAYKKEQPNTFNTIPLIGISFIPFTQVSSNENSIVLDDKNFVFQFGVGFFTNVLNQSKFVIEPAVSLDTSANFGASLSASFIF
ncbi:MAG: hypothetical protein JJ892_05900 [Balneola sp.]|nr:hypothetical protein [Balneola sp.]MBO6870764.1 hypothetical protein [Balneola sp.]